MPEVRPPQPVNITEHLGDTLTLTLTYQTDAGAAESHSGSSWSGKVRTSPGASTVAATFTIDETNEATGIVVCTLSAATTAALTVDQVYYYDIEETTSAGAVVTQPYGTIVWRQDVTRA